VTRVLIVGVSARAAAESAARAGFDVTTIDAFADLDQHPAVRAVSVRPRFTARAAARAASAIECDAVVYLSNFENHGGAVRSLASGRTLWGNAPEVLRRVRDPLMVAETLRRKGFAVPEVRLKPDTTSQSRQWLVKPLASGGGHRIRPWHPATPVPSRCYLQERIDGTPGSVVFVAAGGRAVVLGVTRQLVGEHAFGTSGYRYCGNILDDSDAALVGAASSLARAATAGFDLVGVNGVDFVARDSVPYAVEINPRWCASMELVERAHGLSVFGVHTAACSVGALPGSDSTSLAPGSPVSGKAIVFARHEVVVGDTHAWLTDSSVRDVPRRGERIRAGQPVCTVFAVGNDAAECYAALVRRADAVYAALAVGFM
jgi:uncharacterized protein